MASYPPAVVVTTAPGWRQVKELLWREIHGAYRDSQGGPLPLGGTLLDTKLEWAPGAYAIGLSTNEPTRFLGFHSENILLIADEAPGVGEDVFAAAGTILTSENARELLIGNPYEVTGHFYEAFHGARTLYHTITISAFDTPNFTAFGITLDDIRNGTWKTKITSSLPRPYLVTPEWVAEKWEIWARRGEAENHPLWQVQVLGQFPEMAERQLIFLGWIEAAINREVAVSMNAPYILGCDVARGGSSETAIAVRQGDNVESVHGFWSPDTMVTAGRVIEMLRAKSAKGVWAELDGLGAGVVDRLREQAYPVGGLHMGGEALDKSRFPNRRSELWWNLRERFRLGNIRIPRDDRLITQLIAMKYDVKSDGRTYIVSKDDMVKDGFESPDRADALMLAFAGDEVKTRTDDRPRNVFGEAYFGRGTRRKRRVQWLK